MTKPQIIFFSAIAFILGISLYHSVELTALVILFIVLLTAFGFFIHLIGKSFVVIFKGVVAYFKEPDCSHEIKGNGEVTSEKDLFCVKCKKSLEEINKK